MGSSYFNRRTFAAPEPFFLVPDHEFDQIADQKLIDAWFLHFRLMKEQIHTVRLDESESAVADDFLDLSLGTSFVPFASIAFQPPRGRCVFPHEPRPVRAARDVALGLFAGGQRQRIGDVE